MTTTTTTDCASWTSWDWDYSSHASFFNNPPKDAKSPRQSALDSIKKVIFNDPATIVYWADGTKTVVKCDHSCENFDKEKGLAMAIVKKHFDNQGYYYDVFKKFIPELDDEPIEEEDSYFRIKNNPCDLETQRELGDALNEWWESQTTKEERKDIKKMLNNLKSRAISAEELNELWSKSQKED